MGKKPIMLNQCTSYSASLSCSESCHALIYTDQWITSNILPKWHIHDMRWNTATQRRKLIRSLYDTWSAADRRGFDFSETMFGEKMFGVFPGKHKNALSSKWILVPKQCVIPQLKQRKGNFLLATFWEKLRIAGCEGSWCALTSCCLLCLDKLTSIWVVQKGK